MKDNYKHYFPWFKNHQDLVYFDNAATTLKPASMIKAINSFNSNEPCIFYKNKNFIKKQIFESKKYLAKFLQANMNEVFYTSGSTLALNIIADTLQDIVESGDEIIVHYLEHGSNLLPWYRLRERKKIKLIFVGKDSIEINENTFLNAITNKTKIIAFTSASNLLANWVDTKKIIQEIKKINPNIYVVLDATQQLEHFPALCHDNNCDFLVGSAHKIIGPTGLGFFYMKKAIQNNFKNFNLLKDELNNLEINYAATIGFLESLKLWLKIGYKAIAQKEQKLKTYFLKHINTKRIKLFTPSVESPLITFNMYDDENNIIDGQDIEFYLEQNKILGRSSLSCAKLARVPLKTRSVVRISLFFYNDLKDVKKLVKALNEFKPGDELNGLI